MLTTADVAAHYSRRSCWVIISGNVYDVTDFLDDHPGGASTILRFAGKDATEEYEPIHPPGTIESHLPKEKNLGPVAVEQAMPSAAERKPSTSTIATSSAERKPTQTTQRALPLSACQSLEDLEQAARAVLTPKALAYFGTSAETTNSMRRNRSDWGRISFRPRILRNVAKVSMSRRIIGHESSLPIFIAPAAAARLAHKDGELGLARGAAQMNIPQCVCTYASIAPKDIMAEFKQDPKRRGGALFFQLYVPKVKKDAAKLMAQAKACGFQALIVTVDSPVIGKRDEDDRFKALLDQGDIPSAGASPKEPALPGAEAETLRGVHCSTLEWSDLAWIRKCWGDSPIILKGIQTFEDALEAISHGVDGIYLSNHGGRQIDYAPSAVKTLLEIRQQAPSVFQQVDVYVDGGVMRGSDVVKALCLGARGVGIGRGFLYALGAYGTDGVLRAIQILSEEIQTTMRLLGVTDLNQLGESLIDISELGQTNGLRQLLSKM